MLKFTPSHIPSPCINLKSPSYNNYILAAGVDSINCASLSIDEYWRVKQFELVEPHLIDDEFLRSFPTFNRLEIPKWDIFLNLFGTINPLRINYETNLSGGHGQFQSKQRRHQRWESCETRSTWLQKIGRINNLTEFVLNQSPTALFLIEQQAFLIKTLVFLFLLFCGAAFSFRFVFFLRM